MLYFNNVFHCGWTWILHGLPVKKNDYGSNSVSAFYLAVGSNADFEFVSRICFSFLGLLNGIFYGKMDGITIEFLHNINWGF